MLQKTKSYIMICFLTVMMSMGTSCNGPTQLSEEIPLIISAAASLANVLEEIIEQYHSENPHVKIQLNTGGSGALQKQIENGAPVDLYISAASEPMVDLIREGIVLEKEQSVWLHNALVVVVPVHAEVNVHALPDLMQEQFNYIAIGIPETVPAGQYAREALTRHGLWDSLASKTIQAKDVKQVLQYVETANADAGFVYETDAVSSNKVKIAYTVPSELFTRIEYRLGMIRSTTYSEESQRLYQYLQSEEALSIVAKYGFSIPKG